MKQKHRCAITLCSSFCSSVYPSCQWGQMKIKRGNGYHWKVMKTPKQQRTAFVVKAWQRQRAEERVFCLLKKKKNTDISFNELCQLCLETIHSVELIITFAGMYIKETNNCVWIFVRFPKVKKKQPIQCVSSGFSKGFSVGRRVIANNWFMWAGKQKFAQHMVLLLSAQTFYFHKIAYHDHPWWSANGYLLCSEASSWLHWNIK